MRRIGSEVVGSLFWLAVGIFFAIGGLMVHPGTPRNPGPGFLPLIMASLLICFSLAVLTKGLVWQDSVPKGIAWKSQVSLVAAVLVYGVLLDLLGFLLSTFLLMFVLFGRSITSEGRWAKALLYAAATALIGWLVFSVALKVPFPQARLPLIGS